MTRDKLKELQHNAALDLIVKFRVQMDYRRSVPLSVERVIEYWDVINAQYDEKMDSLMQEYSEFCPECHQHFACANCTAEQCNQRREPVYDDFRPRDMGRHCDWSVLDFIAWQNERRL